MKNQFLRQIENIQFYIQPEVFLILWTFLFIAFIFYKFFLKKISLKRHINLKGRFSNNFYTLMFSVGFATVFWTLRVYFENYNWLINLVNIAAILSFISVTIAVIFLAQIYTYLYLFFMNISQGIPRLIVNLFTVIFSIIIITYLASDVFAINLTAMLATSAVFSLVLGLALQDTLGNLFSGVAMQIGKPFTIGDWIEVNHDSHKWMGQVQEITWRATFISSFSDEWIMIPNKTIAQSQIVILTNSQKAIRLSHLFRIDFNQDVEKIKKLMLESIKSVNQLMIDPEPRVLFIETTESWVSLKIFYSIKDFSLKYRVADEIQTCILEAFKKNNVILATSKILMLKN